MRAQLAIVSLVLLAIGIAVVLAASRTRADDDTTRAAFEGTPPPGARETLVAAATAGLVPEGLVIATRTPDLSAAVPATTAVARLGESPRIAALFRAIAANDLDILLATVDWKVFVCRTRDGEACVPDATPGPQPMIVVGEDTFYVNAEMLRPSLAVVMRGEPLQLRYAAQSLAEPSTYVLVFEGPAKGPGINPVTCEDCRLNGLVLTIDVDGPQPVQHIQFLVEGQPAVSYGRDYTGYSPDWRILVFDDSE